MLSLEEDLMKGPSGHPVLHLQIPHRCDCRLPMGFGGHEEVQLVLLSDMALSSGTDKQSDRVFQLADEISVNSTQLLTGDRHSVIASGCIHTQRYKCVKGGAVAG
eukprot:6223349-Amphidinium_carterae.3